MVMRPYGNWFRIELATVLTYRANFVFGRIRELVVACALGFLYTQVTETGPLATYGRDALLQYLFLSTFVATILSAYAMHTMANEIADGDLTNYLLRPTNYLLVWVSRMAAVRCLSVVMGCFELMLLWAIFRPVLAWPGAARMAMFVVFLLGSVVLLQLLDLLAGCLGFWTHRSHGPRWMLTMFVQLLSGAFLPIDAFPRWVRLVLEATPFPSLIFAPVRALVGDTSVASLVSRLGVQIAWSGVLAVALAVMWRRGVRSYDAVGR